jgi:hypothetical protein
VKANRYKKWLVLPTIKFRKIEVTRKQIYLGIHQALVGTGSPEFY